MPSALTCACFCPRLSSWQAKLNEMGDTANSPSSSTSEQPPSSACSEPIAERDEELSISCSEPPKQVSDSTPGVRRAQNHPKSRTAKYFAPVFSLAPPRAASRGFASKLMFSCRHVSDESSSCQVFRQGSSVCIFEIFPAEYMDIVQVNLDVLANLCPVNASECP